MNLDRHPSGRDYGSKMMADCTPRDPPLAGAAPGGSGRKVVAPVAAMPIGEQLLRAVRASTDTAPHSAPYSHIGISLIVTDGGTTFIRNTEVTMRDVVG